MASTPLDDEIERLQARADALKSLLRIQTSTILAAPPTRALLTTSTAKTRQNEALLARADAQLAHNQQSLYRACASLTTFRARDPDPNAVDAGAILGVRVEVVSRAKFLRPYYVLLNRPYGGSGSRSRHLRVHRHTVPPCIPLAGLAARYLAPPPSNGGQEEGKQDLAKFARALRRELVRYHHRLGVVADLRKAAGLGGKKATGDGEEGGGEDGEGGDGRLVDISAADAEAKQISIQWADGRTGRLVMGDDGEIVKVVAVGDHGRDREAVRQLFGDAKTVGEVARRLAEP
ncbi:Cenp-O kinetochore centromere component-domain-containing protein [Schizothecium vesticola]|uniref:Cenp-O kinetochore centromere component-domain-containing protein n=1 Tax=Schizothecium vesticola TaxID=314040 RepID=A0AA40K8R0_9PEZI|nr:Cenp-O kinetochore centromere component-domain-containing protein [Schizothecium vesticola]